jgi:hypothetical protein
MRHLDGRGGRIYPCLQLRGTISPLRRPPD